MSGTFAVSVQRLLPHRLLAGLVYRLARCTWPAVKNPLIRWFAARYAVNLEEAEGGEPGDYASFNDFFTRRLKPGARPIAGDERTLISPVDGVLTQFGTARDGELIQAKGMSYGLGELLGEPGDGPGNLLRGSYATLYLSPSHYHRVHLPLTGAVTRTRYIPGRRFSVNARAASAVPGLFCRNERVVCWFETPAGPLALVLVGAFNVSSISTRWLGEITSGGPRVWEGGPAPGHRYRRGEETAAFNLGSTVILILPPGRLAWRKELRAGQPVRLGEALGRLTLPGEPHP